MFPPTRRFSIAVEKQFSIRRVKQTFPLRYGRYSEIKTENYEFLFNLNGEIKYIRGLRPDWPHPAEQLKRTDGNDWVYYSVGDDSSDRGVISWLGEYYLPLLPYPNNSIWGIDYFSKPSVMNAFAAWSQLFADLWGGGEKPFHTTARELIGRIAGNHDGVLLERSQQLHRILGERVSVLPPDTRHVDYEVIPVMIADGCLYHCKFCCIQSTRRFTVRTSSEIGDQIQQLKKWYCRNIENYSAVFLGNHDALAAGEDAIIFTAREAFKEFGMGNRGGISPMLFLFGSVHSLLSSDNRLFETLNRLPFHTWINVGLESVDGPTLSALGKPVSPEDVRKAFHRMLEVNSLYSNVEITANFVIGNELSEEHYQSLKALLQKAPVQPGSKGAVYLSPLKDSPNKRELLPLIHEIQQQTPIPVTVYIIQRL
jgi:hypothetical protein